MNDLIEILKVVVPLLLGAAGTWLAQRLKTKPEKAKDEASVETAQTAAARAIWELSRDQLDKERAAPPRIGAGRRPRSRKCVPRSLAWNIDWPKA
jgi:hypothetical protein